MKKTISIILVISLLLSFNLYVFAVGDTGKDKIVVNEYQMLKDLKAKSGQELKDLGYQNADIEKIKNTDYKEELKKRSELDENTLKNYGYTAEQIKKLKGSIDTEEQVMSLAATFTLSANVYGHYFDGTKTYYSVYYSWNWSTLPVWCETDIIGYGYMTDFIKDPNYQYNRVDYQNTGTQAIASEQRTITGVAVGSAQSKFPMIKNKADNMDYDYDWARSGYGRFGVYKTGRVAQCAIAISYGHSTTSFDPYIAYPAGLSIGFSSGVEQLDTKVVESSLD